MRERVSRFSGFVGVMQSPPEVTGSSGPIADRRDFVYSEDDFKLICKMIYRRVGISLAVSKRDMVYNRLSRRLRALRIPDFASYLKRLTADEKNPEWEPFVNALTTNTTSFFRESHHFPMLAELLLANSASRSNLSIWCSAASTGEEPYSIAMTVADTLGPKASQVSILATDVDTEVLKVAAAGVYPDERVEKMAPDLLRRHFLRGKGDQAGNVRVRPELCQMVDFAQLNLLAPEWPMRGQFDAIFCRNVLIYFDRQTQAQIVTRFAPLLRPDGVLFIGHSESLFHVSEIFRLRGQTTYQRIMPGEPLE